MECPKCSQKVLRSQLVKNYNTNLLENILTATEETGYTTSNLNLINDSTTSDRFREGFRQFHSVVLLFAVCSRSLCNSYIHCVIGNGEDLMKSSDSRCMYFWARQQMHIFYHYKNQTHVFWHSQKYTTCPYLFNL